MDTSSLTLELLLKTLLDRGASDLHITVGSPPILRVDGDLIRIKTPSLSPEDTERLCCSGLSEEKRTRFAEDLELDLSIDIANVGRFRVNLYRQRGSVAGAFRTISTSVPSLEELGLPPILEELSRKPRGLVLVTGPTGSGKSTTLASMVDLINRESPLHILTIEDPIEYLHEHRRSVVNQREVGPDTKSFRTALKYVLREDPDVVLIGEMRDLETIEAALTVSETGHLVLATLHTNSAVQTINRVIDVFPPYQRTQVRTQLSFVLEGVVSQMLVPRSDGPGRVVACEVMIPTAGIRNLIREEKTHQLYSQMQIGQAQTGMQTMNQALYDLHSKDLISLEMALSQSSEQKELKTMISQDARNMRTSMYRGAG
jgi:twitching motility protein PilT